MKEINISFALRKLMTRINYDSMMMANVLGVDIKSINNYLNKHTNPSPNVTRKICILIDENNLNIYQLFDIEGDDGYLFHGSQTGGLDGKISALKNKNEINDFDYGFYLSDSLKNAINYIIDKPEPVVYRFKKEDVIKGKIYNFSEEKHGEQDWILYIGLNRNKITNSYDKMFFKEYYDKKFSDYDILIGEIADSYNFDVLNDFFNNLTDLEETRQALLLANIGQQFVMKNEKFANELIWVDEYRIEKNLRNYLLDLVRKRKTILKKNRGDFSKNHSFNREATFEVIKNTIKKQYE